MLLVRSLPLEAVRLNLYRIHGDAVVGPSFLLDKDVRSFSRNHKNDETNFTGQ
ncbi:MAG: hypothetical protein KDB27_10455 [Planctomycetales bacterium]|nr:hypothetical protein [Planctomycetales bacterium]